MFIHFVTETGAGIFSVEAEAVPAVGERVRCDEKLAFPGKKPSEYEVVRREWVLCWNSSMEVDVALRLVEPK